MTVATDVVAFGDRAWLITTEDLAGAHRLGAAIEGAIADGAAPPGTAEATVGMCTVVIHLEPPWGVASGRQVTTDDVADGEADAETWRAFLSTLPDGPARGDGGQEAVAEPVEVPTVFDGPDLEEVASLVGTRESDVVRQLCDAALQVAFIGFSPGFPYLVGLPEGLADVPRRPSPRTEVPAGSVALAGGFAGIYPQATPGGWRIVGRTALRLFDPTSPPFARLRAGDHVRLTALTGSEAGERRAADGDPRQPMATRSQRAVQVIDPGLFTTVQDGGRAGVAGIGVPRAGPCDPDAMRLANRLAGNDDRAAALEITASGPRLRFGSDGHVAVVGAGPEAVEVSVDNRPAVDSAPVPVAAGQTVTVGRVTDGFRAYLAPSGGFAIPAVLGSRASDVLSGLGPGLLRPGDRLPLGPPARPRGSLLPGTRSDRSTVRVMAGPHGFPPDALQVLVATRWTVSASSSRVGIRLESADACLPRGPSIPSTGMVTGAVQVPPDGRPIVLMPDHATVGGYPVVATVIGVDVGVLGQLAPGDGLRFVLVDRPTAIAAARQAEEALAARIRGWYPTQPAL